MTARRADSTPALFLINGLYMRLDARDRANLGGFFDKLQARFEETEADRDRYKAALEEILERHAPGDGEADYDIAERALNGSSTPGGDRQDLTDR